MARLTLLLFFVSQVVAEVKETTQDYICTGEPYHVESEYAMKNPGCDQYWSHQDHSIGTLQLPDSTLECHIPCKELTAGKIVLTDCVNITLAVICSKASGMTESRVHFYGKMVPQSLHNSVNRAHIGAFSAVGALIFFACLLCGGWLYHKHRSNVQNAAIV